MVVEETGAGSSGRTKIQAPVIAPFGGEICSGWSSCKSIKRHRRACGLSDLKIRAEGMPIVQGNTSVLHYCTQHLGCVSVHSATIPAVCVGSAIVSCSIT